MPAVPLVRRLEASEGATLKDVRLAALLDAPSAFGSTDAAEVALSDTEWAERARAASAGDKRVTFVAETDGRVVGLVGGFRSPPAGPVVELVPMWVVPAGRRTGAARALVGAVVDWAAATTATSVELWVTRGSAPAEALYRARGFVETGGHQPLPSDPSHDELRMRRGVGVRPIVRGSGMMRP